LIGDQTNPEGLPNKSEKHIWNPVKRSDISGVQNQTVRFAKLDTLVLTAQMIIKELRENLWSWDE
jgi:hypothetical protein